MEKLFQQKLTLTLSTNPTRSLSKPDRRAGINGDFPTLFSRRLCASFGEDRRVRKCGRQDIQNEQSFIRHLESGRGLLRNSHPMLHDAVH